MIHPHTELRFINPTVGFGVVATARIPRGTITWARDPLDIAMSEARARALGPLYRATLDRFTFTDGMRQRILCWDIARYVNHSCEPGCLAPGFDFEIAVRDIEAGEELCDDYGTLNPVEPFDCACDCVGCRRVVLARRSRPPRRRVGRAGARGIPLHRLSGPAALAARQPGGRRRSGAGRPRACPVVQGALHRPTERGAAVRSGGFMTRTGVFSS